MSDGEHHAALTSWVGAERAHLEDRRSRLERQIEALAEVEAAVGRYRALCLGTPDAVRRTGDEAPGGREITRAPGPPSPVPAADPGEQDCERCGAPFELDQRGS